MPKDAKSDDDEAEMNDMIAPYQQLLNELNDSRLKPKLKKEPKKKRSKPIFDEASGSKNEAADATDQSDQENSGQPDAYSQEVLCKDSLESEDAIQNGTIFSGRFTFVDRFILSTTPLDPFHLHFEVVDLADKQIERLELNLNDRGKLKEIEKRYYVNGC